MNSEEHLKNTTFESLITMNVIPYVNGKKLLKEKMCFDKTSNCTISEVASTIAIKYGLSTKDVILRIPNENDEPLYTVSDSLELSKIGDSSILYACMNTL